MELQRLLENRQLSSDEIASRTRTIYETVLRESPIIDAGNFHRLHPDDLALLFGEYDRHFFDGGCRRALGDRLLDFRLSKRMVRSGGKTTRYTPRNGDDPFYEIAISSPLLFRSILEGDRPITVTGLTCRDRLEALQRVFEHELVHLIEMLVWAKSSCTGQRFQSIAHRFFGHTDHRHQLITPMERAATEFGVRPGSRVKFRFDGAEYTGFVNRITKRATVLVEDRRGQPYSDGNRYTKFYVPVGMLEVVE